MTSENTVPVSQEDVTAFVQKLENWGKELPPKERALLQILLSRAEGTSPADVDVQGYALPSIGLVANSALSPLLSAGRLGVTGAWVEMGDPWAQWSARSAGLAQQRF